MSAIDTLLQEPVAQAIGWALIHFVWQGALIGLLTAAALLALRRSAAEVRYVVAAIALALMATMPLVTAVQTWRTITLPRTLPGSPAATATPRDALMREAPAPALASAVTSSDAPVSPVSWRIVRPAGIEPWLPVFVLAWLSGVVVLTLRLLGGWLWVQRMKSDGANAVARELQAIVERVSTRMHIRRRVRLLQSSGVDVPTVIGWAKPVILLPVTALAGLSLSQVEAILAHELAHIRRHDYLVNLLQTLLETMLFYHPAVWWLSRRIRAEREHCCDDLAVSLCGDPVAYARALADLEGRRAAPVHLALAANGGTLLQRVRRLLVTPPPSHAGRSPVWLAGASALVLMAGIALTAVSGEAALAGTIQPQTPSPAAPRVLSTPEVVLAAPTAPRVPVASPVRSGPDVSLAPEVEQSQSAPSPPSPPSPPSAPSAPAGVSRSSVSSSSSGQTSGNLSWSSNGEKLEVNYTGEFEFSDDDRDVKRMAPGSRLKISDGGWFRGKSAEFSADASGRISRRYWAGASERPFEPEGRQWLEQSLPKFIRQTGIGAKARVARVLKNGGPSAVLTEIGNIDGSYAKRLYFAELVNNTTLDQATAARVLEQAGREVDSDYELASLLIASGDKLMASESTRKAYFDAVRGIDSDFEMRRVLSAALSHGTVTPPVLSSLLDTSRGIDSDYELATLLAQVAKTQSVDSARAPFFAALALIDSDFEQRRAMSAVLRSHSNSDESVRSLLKAAHGLDSDFERAEFLSELARVAGADLSSSARADFQRVAASIGSDHERSRALAAFAKTERR